MITQKRISIMILVASLVALAVGVSPQIGRSAGALTPAQAPETPGVRLPYSGRLTIDGGRAAPDGAYDFIFTLYPAETGGTPVWTETQTGVAVNGGTFAVLLGGIQPIPKEVLTSDDRWLEVAVRGAGEGEFTALIPRQLVSNATPASPSSPSAGATCAHDHIGEVWSGSVPWANGVFKVDNNQNGPSIWGVNTGGGNAVRGDGYFNSIGVYGEGDTNVGVAGNSVNNDGVSGGSSGSNKSGVYGTHGGVNFGYGVYGNSESGRGIQGEDGGAAPDDSYGVYSLGDMYTSDDLTVADTLTVYGLANFTGGKVGFVVDIAQNDDSAPLETGDVVVISGVGPAVAGQIPVIQVRRASAGEEGAVVGVVDQHYIPPPKIVQRPGLVETKAEIAVDESAILPGEYLTVVTLGAYRAIKVDASYGAVKPGSLLVASPRPGYAMRAAALQPGTIVGKALEALEEGAGLIPVIVTLQ